MFIFFSQLDGVKVTDKDRVVIGRLFDILIEPIGKYAKAKALIIERGGLRREWATIEWRHVVEVSAQEARLTLASSEIQFMSPLDHKADLSLRQDILDQQVVDTNNQNVIRVNDIHLLIAEKDLVVAHADIGLRGIVRRLGFEGFIDSIVKIFNRNSSYLTRFRFISWKHIQPLSINPVSMTIKVDVSQKQLLDIPAEDLGEMMLDLTPRHRLALFKTLDIGTRGRLFMSLDVKEQKSLLEDLGEKEAVELLNQLPMDEAVDFLGELPKGASGKILGLMESKNAKMLSTLLGYSGESAGGLMTTEYIAVLETATIEQTLLLIKEKTPKAETIQSIYIVDQGNHLIGSTSMRRLIIANTQDNVMKASIKKTATIRIEDEVKKIALLMDKYSIYALPVVDANNVLVGIITIDDIFSRLVSIAYRRKRRAKQI
jgi:CBS domain-containing protein